MAKTKKPRPLTKIGREIEALQARAGWGGNDVGYAVALGVHPNTIYKWKVGDRKVRNIWWDKMRRMADGLAAAARS